MVWLTVELEMIVLLEYIDLLVIQGCKISGQAIAGLAVAVPPALLLQAWLNKGLICTTLFRTSSTYYVRWNVTVSGFLRVYLPI